MLNTVSTADAYVNGYVTFVASRVPGQIARIFVDNNNRVRKGDLLAELDKQPYQIVVSERQAAVGTAKAELQSATAAARRTKAQSRSERWNLQRALEGVDSQVALLHAWVAAVVKNKAALVLAQLDFNRARQLVAANDVPVAEYDRRQAAPTTAGAEVEQSFAEVCQIRVSLGLSARPPTLSVTPTLIAADRTSALPHWMEAVIWLLMTLVLCIVRLPVIDVAPRTLLDHQLDPSAGQGVVVVTAANDRIPAKPKKVEPS